MRKLVVVEFLSVDGVMQSLGDPHEDPDGFYEHGGWGAEYFDDTLGAAAAEGMAGTDAYLFGRKTYQGMARYWPTVPDDDPMAAHLNSTPKYVVSRTLSSVEWANSTLLTGDLAAAVGELKLRDGGNIVVLGSGQLVRTLMEHDLVDEYRLFVHPIVLGSGKRLFGDAGQPRRLKLVEARTSSLGSQILGYVPA
ncbi:MAG TPA: dihydrofolate reductase family protein [Actinophytocola sp.]|uniref:dihydrofolate reductase family protein n=1 Tax=Actinophytocola sp. TaxID=1872138 RepID=UPI002DDDA8E0|nr:dihydrofolate reductase family protein [Actinophytocola sp.]HEV2780322.1 dihydrofolate reductase family protein [Actinophytocola sp.]